MNAALRGQSALAPHALLALLKRSERELGRAGGVRFGPRVVDLDLWCMASSGWIARS